MKSSSFLSAVIAVLCLIAHFSASAEDVLAPASSPHSLKSNTCSRPIQIAVSPLGRSMIISPDGKISGSTPAFFDLIAKDTGCVFEYLIVPRARAIFMLERGQIDLISDATRAPKRDQVAHFFEIGGARAVLISLRNKNIKLKSIPALIASPVTLITFSGHYWGQEYLDLLAQPKMQGRVSPTSSPEVALKMLLHGRADAILTGQAVMVDAWEKMGHGVEFTTSELEGLPTLAIGLYMSNARMSKQDMDLIESAITARIKSGDLSKIIKTYYPSWAIYTIPTNKLNTK